MKSIQPLLSAVILTRNEEHNISRCLSSLSFCDQIILIDDYSTDETIKIAKNFDVTIYKRHLHKNFAAQRNYGLKMATGKWVLFVDADEVVTRDLADEILFQIIDPQKNKGFFVRRIDILWNRKVSFGELASFGAFGNGYILRLAKRDSGLWSRRIHEVWKVQGKTDKLKQELIHYPHQTYFEFLEDIGKRSGLHAATIKSENKSATFSKIFIWPVGKFLYNYLYKLGFVDGERGFILAMTMSFHSFISWSYLWLNQK